MRGLAYDTLDDGHRRFNLKTWQDNLGLDPLIARPSFSVFIRLLRAERLMFATLDDAPLFFAVVGFVRAFLFRKTVGIFMRPHLCFRRDHYRYRAKWLFFRFLQLIPSASAVSMIPHFVNSRFREVSRDWIYDPQNWDLVKVPPDLTRPSALAEDILHHARGRTIIAALGGLNRFKGFHYLGEIAASVEFNPETHVVIACGPLSPENREAASAITRSGGYVVDSYISDADMMAIYGVADFVWACYPEANDQASGIFGRASQLGVPAIVREGSFNSLQAQRMDMPYLAIPFDDPVNAAKLMMSADILKTSPDWPMIERLKAESLARLKALL